MSTDTPDTMNEDSVADDWAQALEEQAASGAAPDSAPAFDAPNAPAAPASSAGATSCRLRCPGHATKLTRAISVAYEIPVLCVGGCCKVTRIQVPVRFGRTTEVAHFDDSC